MREESRSFVALACLLLAFSSHVCCARKWTDVVDPTIYFASAIDLGRLENLLKRDPFDFRPPPPTASPTHVIEEPAGIDSPTDEPTPAASSATPTFAPTDRYEFVVGNGGCPVGESLFEIRMVDSWGDGWDMTSMQIFEEDQQTVSEADEDFEVLASESSEAVSMSQTVKGYQAAVKGPKLVFAGSLARGEEAFKYACLDDSKCFSVTAGGGMWQEEAKWEIRMVELGVPREERKDGMPAAKGLAPTTCQFSIPNKATDELPCPVTCGIKPTEVPTLSPNTMTPTPAPSNEALAPTLPINGTFPTPRNSPLPTPVPTTVASPMTIATLSSDEQTAEPPSLHPSQIPPQSLAPS